MVNDSYLSFQFFIIIKNYIKLFLVTIIICQKVPFRIYNTRIILTKKIIYLFNFRLFTNTMELEKESLYLQNCPCSYIEFINWFEKISSSLSFMEMGSELRRSKSNESVFENRSSSLKVHASLFSLNYIFFIW